MQLFSPLSEDLFEPGSEFEQAVVDFCKQWKSGQATFLFHTSGSTGIPKPIWVDRKAMEASALATGKWLQLVPKDVTLACLPVQYIAGAMVLVRAMVLDLQVCLVEPSSNPLKDLAPITIHVASFVPNQWHHMLHDGTNLVPFFQHAKGVLLGGSSLSVELANKSLGYQFPIFETYGMTETVSHIGFKPLGRTYFQTFDSIEIGIDGRNCLAVKGLVTGNAWIQTNDIINQLSNDSFELLGRFDRVINSAGRKVHPEKLEKFIALQVNKPQDFFIEALPDEQYGQQVTLFYLDDFGFDDQQQLAAELRTKFESWEIPKQYIQLPTFQFTSSGKIDRLKSVALHLKSN